MIIATAAVANIPIAEDTREPSGTPPSLNPSGLDIDGRQAIMDAYNADLNSLNIELVRSGTHLPNFLDAWQIWRHVYNNDTDKIRVCR